MRLSRLSFVLAIVLAPAAPSWAGGGSGSASASASVSVSIKADVNAKGQAQAAAGDTAYAAGKFDAALAAYGEGFAQTRDSAFIYGMAQCHKALGHKDEAKQMFQMYMSASGSATLKYKADAEAEIGAGAKSTVSKLGGALGKVKETTVKVVADVGAGVYSAAKVSISSSISASAKAEAKAGDEAYAAAKFEDAAKSYAQAYAKSQQAVALYAEAQAKAQAGHGVEARGLLVGYLAAQPNGTYAKDAKTILLAMGGRADLATKVSVKAKVSADAKAQADAGDKAMASGKFIDAASAYGEAYAKKSDAALLYAKGMAQFYAGMTADAATSLKAYLAASGNLEFKASAEASLRASGGAP
jgi:tetratricopeptide (TPR) repeat protein